MNNEHDHFSELIDSCRRADDLQLPELQPLAAAAQVDPHVERRLKKSQRIDAVIGQSIRDVAIPPGLEQRLLAVLAPSPSRSEPISTTTEVDLLKDGDAARDEHSSDQVFSTDHGGTERDVLATVPRQAARGYWKVWLAGVTSVAAALIAFLAISDPAPSFESERDVALQADQWLTDLNQNQWSRTDGVFQEFPLPPKPQLQPPYGRQWVARTHSSLKVACYNLSPTPPSVHLFVCRGARAPKLARTPPNAPTPLASGWVVGVWQVNDLVYVVAVKGNATKYQTLIRRNPSIASIARLQTTS